MTPCPDGYQYSFVEGQCVPIPVGPIDCPPGFSWDPTLLTCVPIPQQPLPGYPPPAPITASNLFCSPGGQPHALFDSSGNFTAWVCQFPDGSTNYPIVVTVAVPPPGYTPVPTSPPAAPAPPAAAVAPPPSPSPPSASVYCPTSPTTSFLGVSPAGCIPTPVVGPQLFGNFPTGSPSNFGSTATSSSSTSVEGGLGSPVYVNASSVVNVADNSASNAVQNVADAVSAGINAAASTAGNIAAQTANDVVGTLSTAVGSITGGVNTAFDGIAGVIQNLETGIGQTLGGIGNTIGQDIFNAINPVSVGLGQIIQVISQQIGGLAGAIGNAVGAIIPTIIAAVTGAISPATAVLTGIRDAIQGSVAALTTIGADITGAGTSTDTTLTNIWNDYKVWYPGFVESTTGYGDGETLHKDFSSLAGALAGLITSIKGIASVKLSDVLTAPCDSSTIQALLDHPLDLLDLKNSFFADFGIILTYVFRWAVKGFPAIKKVSELIGQQVNKECSTELLPPSTLIDAVLRGFISSADAVVEAARGNLNEQRFGILKDLATHQFGPRELIEALYRGIIQPGDYQSALSAQGWTAGQQNVLKALAVPQFLVNSAGSAGELLRRGEIDNAAYDTILKAQNYDDAQRKALIDLAFRPSNLNEATDGAAAYDALQTLGLQDSIPVPEYASEGARNEGLSIDTTNDRWYAHWNLGAISQWIALYFRGQISLPSLQAVMSADFVPLQLQTTLVEAQRPLIQFRTISTMLNQHLIDVPTAVSQLRKHGYTDPDIQLLITYATRPGKAAPAAKALKNHVASLAVAKREFLDGSISENDYYQILLAHEYTIEGANAEIALEKTNEALLERKQEFQFVIDEYGAGIINEQTAIAQLAVVGGTPAELAKALHRIRAFKVARAKNPSEAQLNDFRKNGIITDDKYVSTLELEGYNSEWAQAFLAYRTASVPPATGSPATSAPSGGGTTVAAAPSTIPA